MPRGSAVRALLALAMPMVLARATQSVIMFADALQVSHLGPRALAATATGGLNVIGVTMLPIGIVFIIQSFVAQLAGRGDRDDTPRFAWYGLAIAAVTAVIAAAAVPAIDGVLGLAGFSPETHELMTEYMTIRMFAVGAAVGMEALGNWYGGLGNTWMQMVAGIIAMVANVILNWILIDGHLGAPALGVQGTALASTIATWLGFGFLAIAFWRRWGGAPRARTRRLSSHELGRVVRFGLPNGLNWFLEFAAFQLFVNGVMGSLGDETVAALNVVLAVNSVAFMPAFGLASAGAILAGQAIGGGCRDEVWPFVKTTLVCTGTWMVLVAILYLVFPGPVLGLFSSKHSTNLVALGSTMLVISALWQVFDATAMTFSETLRAAGDTFWTAAARIVLAWCVFTPAAFLVVGVADGGAIGAMLCLVAYIALLALALVYRFQSGVWRTIELIEPKLV
ncbi:MAG TPA: MATE family efflux transporter [Kofleriaceae bacterium]|nr:MATE family efflux transporter [Kofleriaceae bacterium]